MANVPLPKSRTAKGGIVLGVVLALIGGFEGLSLTAYHDPVGIPTICYGETWGVKMGDVKTIAQCRDLLVTHLPVYEEGMAKCSKVDLLSDTSYVALLSFTYNVGVGAYCGSTLVKKLNAGDVRGACDELLKWDKAGKPLRPLPGLTTRRVEERKICLEGIAK